MKVVKLHTDHWKYFWWRAHSVRTPHNKPKRHTDQRPLPPLPPISFFLSFFFLLLPISVCLLSHQSGALASMQFSEPKEKEERACGKVTFQGSRERWRGGAWGILWQHWSPSCSSSTLGKKKKEKRKKNWRQKKSCDLTRPLVIDGGDAVNFKCRVRARRDGWIAEWQLSLWVLAN